ncbi:hypothetical protein H8D83_01275 [Candidatus Woesearchaeota archaeon]|nr:hypothetical protein [Candidatus Woesearchaeota archaeon]
MEKLTVAQYSKKFGVTNQSAYKRIKRGSLKAETIDGIQYILINESDSNNETEEKEVNKISNQQIIGFMKEELETNKEQLKAKDEQIMMLNEQIKQLSSQLSQSLKIQEETVSEKKQNNLLMAGLQKSLGLLEHQTETTKKKSFFGWFNKG